MKSARSRGRVGGCLVLAGGFGVESEPTLRFRSLPSSPASNRWRCREMHTTESGPDSTPT